MTEAILQTSWPSYQYHKQVYCLHSSAKSVHNCRGNPPQIFTYLATLGVIFMGRTVQQGMYKIREKPALHLQSRTLSTAFIGYRVHKGPPTNIGFLKIGYTLT